ncbi:MAG: hypothetical protein GY926_25900 [bacterium]|nr:hypothetical protein [bacterium]
MRRAVLRTLSAGAVSGLAVLLLYVAESWGDGQEGFVVSEPNRYEGDLVFVDAAQDYSRNHPDSGGRWVDWERDVWMFAFTSDLEVHKKALEAAGLDMESGKHELVLVQYTFAELEAVQDLLHKDWALLDPEWEMIRARWDPSTNSVEVGVSWTDQDRVQPFIDFLADRFSFPAWTVVTGAPPIEADDALGSSGDSII